MTFIIILPFILFFFELWLFDKLEWIDCKLWNVIAAGVPCKVIRQTGMDRLQIMVISIKQKEYS